MTKQRFASLQCFLVFCNRSSARTDQTREPQWLSVRKKQRLWFSVPLARLLNGSGIKSRKSDSPSYRHLAPAVEERGSTAGARRHWRHCSLDPATPPAPPGRGLIRKVCNNFATLLWQGGGRTEFVSDPWLIILTRGDTAHWECLGGQVELKDLDDSRHTQETGRVTGIIIDHN